MSCNPMMFSSTKASQETCSWYSPSGNTTKRADLQRFANAPHGV